MDPTLETPPDDNRGPEILSICGAMVSIALLTVILRIWVRARVIGEMGWDDHVIIAAMVRHHLSFFPFGRQLTLSRPQTVMFVEMMIIIPQVSYSAGRHVHYIKPESNVAAGLRLNFVTQPLCLIVLCLTKASVGLFLLRLTPSTRFKSITWGVIVFTVLSSTGNLCTSMGRKAPSLQD